MECFRVPAPSVTITEISGIRYIKLTEDLPFADRYGNLHVVPKGFVSDGASVPRFFWRLLSPQFDLTTLGPSIIHDYRYTYKIGTRRECDEDYRFDLESNNYPKWKATVTYCGLRMFGGRCYGRGLMR